MTFNELFVEAAVDSTANRTLKGGAELIQWSTGLANNIITAAQSDENIAAACSAVQKGGMEALQQLVDENIDPSDISQMADELGEDTTNLKGLLESRRSDRSKSKKKLSTLDGFRKYVASWIAELTVREALGMAYKAPSESTEYGSFESDDYEVITKKIKSLQSKKCRVKATLRYVESEELQLELQEIQQEIDRLNQMRGVSTRVKSTDTVKAVSMDDLRSVIAGMSDEEKAALMAQLAG
uniref:Uncharacterized protein n=1 Tax=Siphoviridae sp. ctn8e14 TaxID=2827936 RepID=A0A8S5T4L4_9CAUD|nr:MAG TPA: hypothetical protein [Siphoviridae sp. ctn8e14]